MMVSEFPLWRRFATLLRLHLFLFLCVPVIGEEQSNRAVWQAALQRKTLSNESFGPLCGVYAACRALRLEGICVEPHQFLIVDFVPVAGGSRPEDLVRLISECSATALPLSRMSRIDLLAVARPVVANVRSTPLSRAYDHWVCVLPDGSDFLVFDGSNLPLRRSAAEFLAEWSGFGIVVSKDRSPLLSTIWLTRGLLMCCIGAVTVIVSCMATRMLRFRGSGALAALSTAVVALSVTSYFVFGAPFDFFRGLRDAVEPYEPTVHFNDVDYDGLVQASRDPETVLIDARLGESCAYGMIEHALNIPVTAPHSVLSSALAGFKRDTPIVIYCQSARCGWDEGLALKLHTLGFSSIRTSCIGWAEYSSKDHADESTF